MGVDWVLVGTIAGAMVFVALVWIFVKEGPEQAVDNNPDPGWRDRKAEATSYWEMAEYRDSIEDGSH